jgi:hypothetical protein
LESILSRETSACDISEERTSKGIEFPIQPRTLFAPPELSHYSIDQAEERRVRTMPSSF